MSKNTLVAVVSMLVLVGAAESARADLVISKGQTSNVDCSGGICNATAADAVLNVKDLKTLLQQADLKVASGSAAQDITVSVPFKWTNPFRLTLDAYRSVTFTEAVTVEGNGAVTLTINDGGIDGVEAFPRKGRLTFWDLTSSLIVNGKSYALFADVKTLSAAIVKHPSHNFALAKFYDASVDGTYGSSPIPAAFSGSLDGLGHTIANATITASKPSGPVGFFATIAKNGRVRNLTLQNFQVSAVTRAANLFVGALAGQNDGHIARFSMAGGHVSGTVSVKRKYQSATSGGIVGKNTGVITQASVDGATIFGNPNAGGLVGYNSGTITQSHFSEIVEGSLIGGLAGYNSGTITQSHFSGMVEGGLWSLAGGIANSNDGTISLSYATGTVEVAGGNGHLGPAGDEGSGGIAAFNHGSIDRSFSLASIDGGASTGGQTHQGYSFAGGIVAQNYGTITNSYAIGSIASWDPLGIGVFVGGLIGADNRGQEGNASSTSTYAVSTFNCVECNPYGFAGYGGGTYVSSYWDLDVSGVGTPCGGVTTCPGVSGLSDTQLKSALPSGFDPAVWAQSPGINNGYPYLLANPPPQ